MKNSNILRLIVTRHFELSLLIVILSVSVIFVLAVSTHSVAIEKYVKLIDILFKLIAICIGALWVLNRYYVHRTDNEQIKIEPKIDVIKGSGKGNNGPDLLIFRLEIINTGKTIFQGNDISITVESIDVKDNRPNFTIIHTWPPCEEIECIAIEPQSWAAINDTFCLTQNILAVRIHLKLRFEDEREWDWHESFKLPD